MNKVSIDILMRLNKKLIQQANSAFEASNKEGISVQQKSMLRGKAKAYTDVRGFIVSTYGYAAHFPSRHEIQNESL